jgi:hypothetical protein
MLASVTWTICFFYGLDYVFAYACFCSTSMGHYTWYLVPCNEISLIRAPQQVRAHKAIRQQYINGQQWARKEMPYS